MVENPHRLLSWRQHHAHFGTEEERRLAKDPDVFLTNLNIQTNLNYLVEKRKVPTLCIEIVEEASRPSTK